MKTLFVLVGIQGAGKSTVLEAVMCAEKTGGFNLVN